MIEIPTVPAAVLLLLGFFSPYGVSFLNAVLPFVKSPLGRKVVAVVVSVVLAVVALFGYFIVTGTLLPQNLAEWFGFALLVLVVQQASYGLVTKKLGADAIERALGGNGADAEAAAAVSRANGRHAAP